MEVTIDLPTPPLPLTTPMTWLTRLPGQREARRSCGSFLEEQLLEHVEQSCVHSCDMILPFFFIQYFLPPYIIHHSLPFFKVFLHFLAEFSRNHSQRLFCPF
jgi:hypothetical protein